MVGVRGTERRLSQRSKFFETVEPELKRFYEHHPSQSHQLRKTYLSAEKSHDSVTQIFEEVRSPVIQEEEFSSYSRSTLKKARANVSNFICLLDVSLNDKSSYGNPYATKHKKHLESELDRLVSIDWSSLESKHRSSSDVFQRVIKLKESQTSIMADEIIRQKTYIKNLKKEIKRLQKLDKTYATSNASFLSEQQTLSHQASQSILIPKKSKVNLDQLRGEEASVDASFSQHSNSGLEELVPTQAEELLSKINQVSQMVSNLYEELSKTTMLKKPTNNQQLVSSQSDESAILNEFSLEERNFQDLCTHPVPISKPPSVSKGHELSRSQVSSGPMNFPTFLNPLVVNKAEAPQQIHQTQQSLKQSYSAANTIKIIHSFMAADQSNTYHCHRFCGGVLLPGQCPAHPPMELQSKVDPNMALHLQGMSVQTETTTLPSHRLPALTHTRTISTTYPPVTSQTFPPVTSQTFPPVTSQTFPFPAVKIQTEPATMPFMSTKKVEPVRTLSNPILVGRSAQISRIAPKQNTLRKLSWREDPDVHTTDDGIVVDFINSLTGILKRERSPV